MYSCVHSFSTALITKPGLPICQKISHTGCRASFQLMNDVFVVSYLSMSGGGKVQKNKIMIEVILSNACLTLWKDFFKPRTCFPEPNQVFLLTKLKQTTTKNNRNLMEILNEEFKSSSLEWESQTRSTCGFFSVHISRYRRRQMYQQAGPRSRCDVMMKKYVY